MSPGNTFSELDNIDGSQNLDGDVGEDNHEVHNGMNFDSKLQLFEQVQQQHRSHSRLQAQSQLRFYFISEGGTKTRRTELTFIFARQEVSSNSTQRSRQIIHAMTSHAL